MVAIVAGNGKGLLNTSLNTVGAAGILGQGILGQGRIRAIVNAVNGNLVLQSQNAQLSGRVKLSDLEKKKNFDLAQTNLELQEKCRQLAELHNTEYTKDDAIAALSDKLQNLMEEVENLKKRR